jgi:hypothetical protein
MGRLSVITTGLPGVRPPAIWPPLPDGPPPAAATPLGTPRPAIRIPLLAGAALLRNQTPAPNRFAFPLASAVMTATTTTATTSTPGEPALPGAAIPGASGSGQQQQQQQQPQQQTGDFLTSNALLQADGTLHDPPMGPYGGQNPYRYVNPNFGSQQPQATLPGIRPTHHRAFTHPQGSKSGERRQ